MTRIKKRKEFGSSAKIQLLEEFTAALARAHLAKISDMVSADVTWQSIGRQPVAGRDAVCKAMTRYGPATAVEIDHVVADGRGGAVDGFVEFGAKRRAFCHVFEFGGAKGSSIRAITTYSIAVG